MKKYLKIILPLVAILLIVFFGVALYKIKTVKFESVDTVTPINPISTSLSINLGETQSHFDISNFVGQTALAATQAKFKVITSGTGVNAFISSINGRVADSKKREFWQFDVNGVEAQVGAGSYIIQKGDLISWHIATY